MSMTINRASKLVAEIHAIDAEMTKLQAERNRRTDALKGGGFPLGRTSVDGGSFTLSENNVYSETIIRDLLTEGQVKRCSKSVLDKGAVKRLYPAAYLAAKEERGLKVSIG